MDTGSHFAMLLIGQPTLRRRLKLAVLAALDQRTSTCYTITGMGAGDTTDYIRQHLTFAGRSDPLFSDDAIHAIHLAARGYPRAVNNLAVTTDDCHGTLLTKAPPESSGGAFSIPCIGTDDDAAIVK